MSMLLDFIGVSLMWVAFGAGCVGVAALVFYGQVRAAIGLALVLAFLGYGEWRAHGAASEVRAAYDLALTKQKGEAATLLAGETTKVLVLERQLSTLKSQLETLSATRQAESDAAEKRLDALAARNNGRLRDPNAERGCSGGGAKGEAVGGAGAGAKDGGEAGGLLSVQLSDLLRGKLREADAINDAYAICRQDALNLRATMNVDPMQLSPPPVP